MAGHDEPLLPAAEIGFRSAPGYIVGQAMLYCGRQLSQIGEAIA